MSRKSRTEESREVFGCWLHLLPAHIPLNLNPFNSTSFLPPSCSISYRQTQAAALFHYKRAPAADKGHYTTSDEELLGSG